ncbi:phenylacetate--CoA ligase family protein [Xenophilus sp. Marseille-Q4582]|uniref:phenylacetate--CoA ligase family protein n=1 Tax=Xenophilus sp. Marseille-Q4582 TaxID=2866600 RepID=UPI001CE3CE77|nr:AMP-binding protein [Xenophilus sp. Marseille-Q4582]
MTDFYDALETRDPAERERDLLAALPRQVLQAQTASTAFAKILDGTRPAELTSRAALARLPVTRKSELLALQQARREEDAFGGFAAIPRGARMRRIFASPGPIYEPEGTGADYWRTARALFAAGFRAGDLIHNSFSYHMTPAGSIMETGAHALGCTVFAGGTGQTEQQLEAIAHLRPNGYAGTPSFLKILLEKAAEKGQSLGTLKKALVSGEAFPPSLRAFLAERGVQGTQCYATADLGLIAYETEAREGLVVDEGVLLEIVRPGTGDPVPEGEVGEVVVTTLNPDYPLIRFGTGDLSAVLPGACPTGRTNVRIRGWMGRADQTTKVRGMFVHPSQVAEVVRRFAQVARARLVVQGQTGEDRMTLKVECAAAPEGLAARLAEAVRDVTKLRAEVEVLAPGALPNDGKVIEDARSYA